MAPDISLPKDIDVTDELEEDLAELAEEVGAVEVEDRWDDLGLEKFTKEAATGGSGNAESS